MKEGWEILTLGDVATFINGDRSTNYPSKKDYVVDGIPFVNAGNLIQAGLDLASLNFISQSKYDSLTQGKFVKGDILFCLRGTLGKHSIVQNELKGAIASSLVIIRTKDGFCNKYISYYLDYKQPFIERLNNGAAQPNIPAKTMKGFSILLPPNETKQQSIVDYLDSAFAKIDAMKANAEKALNEAKALFQASLKEMLEPKEGWEEKTIKECCTELFAGGDVPKPDVSKNKTHKFTVPIYTNGVENDGLYGYTSNARVYEPAVTISARGTIGATFRRCVPFYPAIRLITAVPNKDLLNIDYLYYALKILTVGNSGTSIPQLTIPNIKNTILHVPPLSEQESIVTVLDSLKSKVDRLQENYDKISQECDALKQAILRQVFE